MAWRAGLNEGLRAEAKRRTRTRRLGFGSLGLGVATAAFAALMVLPTMMVAPSTVAPSMRRPAHVVATTVAPDDLMALDREGATLTEYSGAGLAARESDLTEGEVRDVLTAQML